jgi:hypothetical protein
VVLTLAGIGLVGGLMACGGDMPPDDRDATTPRDGNLRIDAGIDGGSPVADSGMDGGMVAVDATTNLDAQPTDATTALDATASSDAASDDAGSGDASAIDAPAPTGTCLGDCSGTPRPRTAGECFAASEGSDFGYVRGIALTNGTTCPSGMMIVGFLMHMDGGCIRTATYFCE